MLDLPPGRHRLYLFAKPWLRVKLKLQGIRKVDFETLYDTAAGEIVYPL
jgi:hypothetical protein